MPFVSVAIFTSVKEVIFVGSVRLCVCVCLSMCVISQNVINGFLMKFCGEMENGPGGIVWILVAIRILSWILIHFPGFFSNSR